MPNMGWMTYIQPMFEFFQEPLRIGYRDWEVVPWSSAEADLTDAVGVCVPLNAEIRVRCDLGENDPLYEGEVLIHELLHAMINQSNLILDEDLEENIVGILAKTFLQVWRDNEPLRDYLISLVSI